MSEKTSRVQSELRAHNLLKERVEKLIRSDRESLKEVTGI
jgi:hypothetical protein